MGTPVLLAMEPGDRRSALVAWLVGLGLGVTCTDTAARALSALGGHVRRPAAVLLDLPAADSSVFLRGMAAASWCYSVPVVTPVIDGAALEASALCILCAPRPWTPTAMRRVLAAVSQRRLPSPVGRAIGRLSSG
jgi:hypothetical protein